MVKVDEITIDPRCQQREIDKDNVDRLVAVLDDGGQFNDPIEVFTDGDSTWLAHGFHRARAYVAAGFKTCHAIVHKGTLEDAIDFSCKPLNAAHGRPETRADRERRIRVMIERHADWSLRKLGEWCGVDHTTIKKYKDESGVGKSTPDRVTGSDGKSYPATKPRMPAPETDTEVIDADTGEVIENPVTVKTTTPKPPSVTVPTVTGEMLYLDADTDAAAQAITDEMGREYASRLANSLTALLKG